MAACNTSCVVKPLVMASSLSRVAASRAQGLLHHVAQFKALRLRIRRDSRRLDFSRCSSDNGDCNAVMLWRQAAWLV